MSVECPFCGASIIEQVVCPKCRRANYDVGITKYICGSIRDSGNEWFRSIECVEAELATLKELLREAGLAVESLLVMMDRGAKPRKLDDTLMWRENDELARSKALAFLTIPEVAKAMGEVDCPQTVQMILRRIPESPLNSGI